MSESEEEKSNGSASEPQPKKRKPGVDFGFKPGNPHRIGTDPNKDPVEMGKKGGHNAGGKVKRLTTYLRRLLEKPISEFPALEKYHELQGEKKAADFLMQRVFEEAAKAPHKAHPLVRDILNRIDGLQAHEIEVSADTPVSVVKFVVVDGRSQVEVEQPEETPDVQ